MKVTAHIGKASCALVLGAALAASATPGLAQEYKLGLVTFLSGGAAGPFGIPARNAGELVIDAINSGTLPAPYNTKGIAGRPIQPMWVDEAGGPSKQVTEYRSLVQKQGVDAVIGYISSGDCLALAPVTEELKKLTVFFDCGTPRVFEERSYSYLFRTGPTALMDSLGAARYILSLNPGVTRVNGINQNYAWGQDSWNDFIASLQKLKPGAQVGVSQMPKLFAGQYSAEISALMLQDAQFVHSSFWGGDMEGFVQQGKARGLFDKQTAILTTGETAMFRIPEQIAEGTVIGGRGPYGVFAPDNVLNKWFREQYFNRFNTWPTYPSYKMAQAILGLKAAADKALAKNPGPTEADIIANLKGLAFEAPSGTVKMAIGNGHQAIQEMVYGRFKLQGGKPAIVDVKRYAAECVNPPDGVKSEQWIAQGFPGARCN
ncbi:MAG: ABC transporter substrate-binding protein [Betaproteobacteria bacterium]|nr:ABC transporter substrate-binding protein [Betaproteobacteria bacterium]